MHPKNTTGRGGDSVKNEDYLFFKALPQCFFKNSLRSNKEIH